jgi:hypothetical protein
LRAMGGNDCEDFMARGLAGVDMVGKLVVPD